MRMQNRREAEKTKRDVTEKVEKIRAKGFKPEDLVQLGYVSKEDKRALNEQSTIIDERGDEESYEGNAASGSPFKSKRKFGTETPESQRSAEKKFRNQTLNVDSNIVIEGEEGSPTKSSLKQKPEEMQKQQS